MPIKAELLFTLISSLVAHGFAESGKQSHGLASEGETIPPLVTQDEIESYPCPREICDCFPRQNPTRMDVICAFDILREDKAKKLVAFNDTNVQSRLLLLCDELDLRVSMLSDGIFESLHAFYNIKRKGCHITRISKEAFRGLESLTTLVIEGGRNTQIDSECLQLPELSRLEAVSITNLGIYSAPNLCNLDNLWFVNLTGNRIPDFKATGMTCNRSTNIEAIIISYNQIRELPKRLANVSTKLGRLTANNNVIYSLEPTLFEGLNSMQIINLNDNRISAIPQEFFGRNTRMHTLELANNRIGKFHNGTLSDLRALTLLRLDGMALTDHVWTQLENLTKLLVLYLNKNKVDTINTDIMHKLGNLGILEMSENKLIDIPNGAFKYQKFMIKLTLSCNKIVSIGNNSFDGLQSLQTLDLKENYIEQIHHAALSNLAALQVLNASSNQLSTLPKFPPSLIVLDLRKNRIINVDNTTFTNLAAMQGINMMSNSLGHIRSHTFRENVALRLLQLAYNNISHIDYDAFGSISMIETLILAHNSISSLSFLRYTEFRFLKTIDLSHNKLVALASGPKLFGERMEEIFLQNNDINFIDAFTFNRSSKLRYVDLRSNQIAMLSNLALMVKEGNMMQVNFFLAGNPFLCDCRLEWLKNTLDLQKRSSHGPYTIRDVSSLYCHATGLMSNIPKRRFLCEYTVHCFNPTCKCCGNDKCSCRHVCPEKCTCYRSNNWDDENYINCMDSKLTSIPVNMSEETTMLDLSGNILRTLKPGDINFPRLKELYMNSSHVHDIVAGFLKAFPSLTYLDLGHNMLTKLFPQMFEGLYNLEALDLRFNMIEIIVEKTFHSLTKLKALDISGNQLQTISRYELGTLSRLDRLWIGNNPWSCQCDYLEEMKNLTLAIVDHIVDFKEVACIQFNNSIEELQRYPLVDIHLPDFCRNETVVYNHTSHETVRETLDTASISVMASMLSLLVIGLVIFGLVFWHRDFLKVWCFVKFGWKFNFGKNTDDEDRMYDAFVSYSSKDEAFVVRELVPHLEDGPEGGAGFRLCVHFRDFAVGASIAESIISAVENSKRVIIILSDNFLSSEWCQYEFQTAHHRLLEERKNRIIMILLHDIDTNLLDNQLRDYLKTRTYVKYGDPWFWPKIEYAMPQLQTDVLKLNHENNVEPDVIPKGKAVKRQRQGSVDSDMEDTMKYIMDNMKNFEADDPKRFAFEMDIELNEFDV